jgi:carbon-monoxide dehydrogenase large subunit
VQPVAQRYVGTPIKRSEDSRILTGRGTYVDDVVLPGMLHAAFVRSPIAHGRIVSVGVEQARQAAGVVAVYTGAEMEEFIPKRPDRPPRPPVFSQLCTDKVRLVGDPIVMVIAETRYAAEDACELVEVDLDELAAVVSAEAALDPQSPPIFEDLGSNVMVRGEPAVFGDLEGAFARADRVVRTHISQHRHQHVPMEGRGCVADYEPASGQLTVHASTQGVHSVRAVIASRLGIDRETVRVIAGDVGGAFGLKLNTSREEICVAAASRDLGRPVKWIEDRNENLTFSGQAREESFDVEAAVTDEGQILAFKVKMLLDAGAYPGMGAMVGNMIQGMMPGPYKLEALSFQTTVAITNKASYLAYRGPWAAETFVRERMVNLIAKELGIDPHELRLRNVARRDEAPLQMVTGRSLTGITAFEAMERIGEVVDLADFRRRQAEARAEGRYLGIGTASYLEAAPGPRGETALGAEQARAKLDSDGTVVVYTGQMPHGQGHQTTLAQIAADQMGVPFEQVRVQVGDTDLVPPGFTGGSLAATMAGGATLHVSRELRSKVLDLAAEMLEASPQDMTITDGRVTVQGVPTRAIGLADIAQAAAMPDRFPLEIDTSLEVATTYDGGEGGWSGGTHCAEVEVDPGTGKVRILRYVVAEDCGELINPAIVEGQVCGGVAQGVGAVLFERSAYGDDGQFLAGSFMDYLVPIAADVPRIEIEHLETVPLDGDVNFRGIGEGGMIVSPPTLCNAIEDALAPFEVRVYEQHLPPQRILELIGAIDAAP